MKSNHYSAKKHTNPPIFVVEIHIHTLLALHSQLFVAPWTIASIVTAWQPQVEDMSFSDILGKQKYIEVCVLAVELLQGREGNCSPSSTIKEIL